MAILLQASVADDSWSPTEIRLIERALQQSPLELSSEVTAQVYERSPQAYQAKIQEWNNSSVLQRYGDSLDVVTLTESLLVLAAVPFAVQKLKTFLSSKTNLAPSFQNAGLRSSRLLSLSSGGLQESKIQEWMTSKKLSAPDRSLIRNQSPAFQQTLHAARRQNQMLVSIKKAFEKDYGRVGSLILKPWEQTINAVEALGAKRQSAIEAGSWTLSSEKTYRNHLRQTVRSFQERRQVLRASREMSGSEWRSYSDFRSCGSRLKGLSLAAGLLAGGSLIHQLGSKSLESELNAWALAAESNDLQQREIISEALQTEMIHVMTTPFHAQVGKAMGASWESLNRHLLNAGYPGVEIVSRPEMISQPSKDDGSGRRAYGIIVKNNSQQFDRGLLVEFKETVVSSPWPKPAGGSKAPQESSQESPQELPQKSQWIFSGIKPLPASHDIIGYSSNVGPADSPVFHGFSPERAARLIEVIQP